MKKFLSSLLALVLILSCFNVFAESESVQVFVTIANGELVMVFEPVTVTDVDNDGMLTINDALYCAHEIGFEGGAEAGYASYSSDWGLSLGKLWGVENGGGYGYYVNDEYAMGLSDTIEDGDYINAWVYTDLETWSDTYSFIIGQLNDDGTLTLTLCAAGFDENYAPITLTVAGATIIINGIVTEFVTDEEGSVTIPMPEEELVLISAVSDDWNLVPPAFVIVG